MTRDGTRVSHVLLAVFGVQSALARLPAPDSPAAARLMADTPSDHPMAAERGSAARLQSVTNYTSLANFSYYSVYTSPLSWVNISADGIVTAASTADDEPNPAVSVALNFTFPFYGYNHTYVEIDPNGFLTFVYTRCGAFCNWHGNFYSRYIAPFMTDLDPSSSPFAQVLYRLDSANNTSRLVVTWQNVSLWHDEAGVPADSFTFQAVLWETGKIDVSYADIPINPTQYSVQNSGNFPLYLGAEDSDYESFRVVARYGRVSWDVSEALAQRTVTMIPSTNCLAPTSCEACADLNQQLSPRLSCSWCPSRETCTDPAGREQTLNNQNGCAMRSTQFQCSMIELKAPTRLQSDKETGTSDDAYKMPVLELIVGLFVGASGFVLVASATKLACCLCNGEEEQGEDVIPVAPARRLRLADAKMDDEEDGPAAGPAAEGKRAALPEGKTSAPVGRHHVIE